MNAMTKKKVNVSRLAWLDKYYINATTIFIYFLHNYKLLYFTCSDSGTLVAFEGLAQL